MKVNDERKANTVHFGTIKCGELFTDKDGDFMMRTESIGTAQDEIFNAVNLETGDMYDFLDAHQVIRINRATLTIYN